jgi:hypothetical protein
VSTRVRQPDGLIGRSPPLPLGDVDDAANAARDRRPRPTWSVGMNSDLWVAHQRLSRRAIS